MDDSTQPTMEPVQPPPPPMDPAPAQPMAPPAGWAPAIRAPLPGSVVGAAVVLLVMGVLTGLMGALLLLSGSIYEQLPDSTFNGLDPSQVDQIRNVSRAFVTGFGIVALVFALAHLASGVGVFRRASWARIVGMVLSGLGVLFAGLILVVTLIAAMGGMPVTNVSSSNLTPEQMEQAMRAGAIIGVVIFGVGFLAYLFTLVALIRNGRAFG
jgi:hypothetical protein